MLKQYQEEFANKNRQFILMNEECTVIESDQQLFDIPERSSILTLHPFFESLPALFDSEEQEFDFYCIHITIGEKAFATDMKLLRKKEGFLLLVTDLTEHYDSYQSVTQSRNESVIKTELTVLKNLKLQERERFKNRFIQNFSHELRNPLTSIMAIIDILDETKLTEEQTKMLDFLKESNSNLRLMLEDTLSIGMIDAGKLEIQRKLFNLRKFFDLIEFTYTTKAKKKGLEFVSSWDAKIPEFVEGDRLRLFQIMTNLLDNAIKYSPEAPKIEITTELTEHNLNYFVDGVLIVQFPIRGYWNVFNEIDTRGRELANIVKREWTKEEQIANPESPTRQEWFKRTFVEIDPSAGLQLIDNTKEGVVEILGVGKKGIDAVMAKIDSLLFKPEVGSVYEVKVIKMLDFGAVVEYMEAPGNEVLLHVSELAWERTENVSDVVNMGDVFDVKYFGIDKRTRKEKVSRKAILPKPEGFVERPPRDNNRSGGRDNRGSRDNRGRDNRRDDRKPREEKKED